MDTVNLATEVESASDAGCHAQSGETLEVTIIFIIYKIYVVVERLRRRTRFSLGSFPDQVRSSWYASGHCMQNLLPLPTQECTIGYLVIECVCHTTVIVSANCIIGCLPLKQVYTYMKDQGNNGL